MRIALYVRHGSEADPSGLMKLARRRGCKVYLPVVGHRSEMEFVRYDEGHTLRVNRFGILEPVRRAHRRAPVLHLDIVFVPLLAVDDHGTRLGSGQGFYDRRLHHLRAGRRWRRPQLIGVAYECQRIVYLAPAPWDVPLDGVLTERNFYAVKTLAKTQTPQPSQT
jgi:5-formyltetrahydrofolate cyclo-ligase